MIKRTLLSILLLTFLWGLASAGMVTNWANLQGSGGEGEEPTSYPTVDTTLTQGFSTRANSHDIDMPSTVDANELLLIVGMYKESTNATIDSGFSEIWHVDDTYIWAHKADGDEGGTTVTMSGLYKAAVAIIYRISDWGGTLSSDVDGSPGANGTTDSPDPDSVTAGWGSDDNLFIVFAGAMNDDVDFTGFPSGYSNGVDVISGSVVVNGANTGCEAGAATREYTAGGDAPGTFTLTESEVWDAGTVVVKPGTSG